MTLHRSTPAALLALALAGCGVLNGSRDSRPTAGPVTTAQATPDVLVGYVNRNAAKVEALEATDLAMEVRQGNQGGGVSGQLFCQKPKNFRLRAKALGKPVADFGSNDTEFWYWISEDKPPYLYHCSYADLAAREVSLPFPFQPDWVLETLGMATLTQAADNFRVEKRDKSFELIERSTTPQGKTVYKVTVFDGRNTSGTTPQITQHRLYDQQQQLVATADVLSVRRDPGTGATVPTHVRLKWPAQKMELELKLDGLKVYSNPAITQRAPDIFTRQRLNDVPSFDLATRMVDGSPSGLQRAGASGN